MNKRQAKKQRLKPTRKFTDLIKKLPKKKWAEARLVIAEMEEVKLKFFGEPIKDKMWYDVPDVEVKE